MRRTSPRNVPLVRGPRARVEWLERRLFLHHGHVDLEPAHEAQHEMAARDAARFHAMYPNGLAAPRVEGAVAAALAVGGQWSGVQQLGNVPVHAHLLPTGKVMFWPYGDAPTLWDPATGAITPAAPSGFNVFCSAHSFLADGRLLVAGGHIQNNVGLATAKIYDPFTNTWSPLPNMNAGRWYPTNTTLAGGDVLVASGDTNIGVTNNLPQVYQVSSNTWRDLSGAQLQLPLYPWMFQAPDGRVLNAGPNPDARMLDTAGTGAWSLIDGSNYGFRGYGSAVMYDRGKVLLVGGGAPTATAEVIDLNQPGAQWQYTGSMSIARRQINATVLPDGTVLVTGGTSGPGFNDRAGAVYSAELWDPATGQFTTLASMAVPRWYHSTAVLLPDGRLFSGGGDDNPSAEVFSPPYLFKGPRPTITGAPASVGYGQGFTVTTPDAADVSAVTLVRVTSVTHAFNMDQRFVKLPFTKGNGALAVTAPSAADRLPPGYYMLFALSSAGVPSVASMLRIGAAADAGLPSVTVAPLPAGPAEAGPTAGGFTVTRTGSTAASLAVSYAVSGSATGGTDYAALTGTVTIPAGAASAAVVVTPVDDALVDPNETVVLTLSGRPDYSVGAAGSATVTIADNDAGGLTGTYFDNLNFSGASVSRTDAVVNFNWGTGSPAPGIGADTFSVRWAGRVTPPSTGTYTFYTRTDDGARLWVNGVRLVNNWKAGQRTIREKSGSVALTAGRQYDLRMEYFEETGSALAELRWSSTGVPKQIVPQSALSPASALARSATGAPPAVGTPPLREPAAAGSPVTSAWREVAAAGAGRADDDPITGMLRDDD